MDNQITTPDLVRTGDDLVRKTIEPKGFANRVVKHRDTFLPLLKTKNDFMELHWRIEDGGTFQ